MLTSAFFALPFPFLAFYLSAVGSTPFHLRLTFGSFSSGAEARVTAHTEEPVVRSNSRIHTDKKNARAMQLKSQDQPRPYGSQISELKALEMGKCQELECMDWGNSNE
ncbi:hypothetical protein B0H14DRAFT_2639874 [Mycena olivaceomarginata]|nr:hypothetical protein B0H14DRAFT_2639874 [Mycena olivaceomarginata]